jgi:SP family facilitated glucose transporter-like MFS transporter 8
VIDSAIYDISNFAVFLLEFMMGIGFGWLAPMLHRLKNAPEGAFTSEQCAWIAALHYVSRGLSPFFSVLVVDRLGRNAIFIFASLICFSMWIAVYCSRAVYVHYAVRLFFGLSSGVHGTASAIYIGENSSSELRGVFSGIFTAFFYFGEVLEFVLAAFLSYEWVALANCAFGLVTILAMLLLKEPAHYLIMRGEVAKAEKNYDWLHNLRDAKKKQEFEDIKQYIQEEKGRTPSFKMFFSKEIVRSVRIILLINFLATLSGFPAINSFVTIALSGSNGLSTDYLTILFGVSQFLSVCMSSVFMDTFNRRTLFLLTSSMITITHVTTAALYYGNTVFEVPFFNWLLFSLLTTYSSMYGMFVLPLTTAIRSEILPQKVKAIGSALSMLSNSGGGFITVKIFLPIAHSLGIHANFLFFSLVGLIMFLYIYVDLPETKGKTLTDIQRELKGEKTEEKKADLFVIT